MIPGDQGGGGVPYLTGYYLCSKWVGRKTGRAGKFPDAPLPPEREGYLEGLLLRRLGVISAGALAGFASLDSRGRLSLR